VVAESVEAFAADVRAGSPEEPAPGRFGTSIIGVTLVMKGELSLDEDLIIDGRFEGPVIDGAHSLSIGTFAKVKADIRGDSAEIAGTVDGDIRGSGTVVLRRTARVRGAISADRLRVEDGTNLENAILSGRISRVED
jgi:cytoskeletal protein CcmA (bactofilin family)